nr:hypothetical protein [Candidatus Freyarchaeota archaeon]
MAKLELSKFKMFEEPPYDESQVVNLKELCMNAARNSEKVYGPVFTAKYIKHSLRFVIQKIEEEPPENIKTLDQLKEYLFSIIDKYPTPHCALIYAGFTTEKELQGQIEAGLHVATMGFSSDAAQHPNCKERNVDINALLTQYYPILNDLKTVNCTSGYRKNEDESFDIVFINCNVKDACQMALDNGALNQTVGGLPCINLSTMCKIFKLLSGYNWDYKLLEFDDPLCLLRCYMI